MSAVNKRCSGSNQQGIHCVYSWCQAPLSESPLFSVCQAPLSGSLMESGFHLFYYFVFINNNHNSSLFHLFAICFFVFCFCVYKFATSF
jgi:hypothetical protein